MSKEQDREKYYLSLNDDDNLAEMEFSFHSNDFIDNEIKEQKTLGNIKTNYEELKCVRKIYFFLLGAHGASGCS